MLFPRSIIVLKNKSEGIYPENINHIISKYTGNCPVCLQDFLKPVISYCEHIYCKECIYQSLEYTQACPVCKNDISKLFNVDLHIKEEIKDSICLKLLCCEDMIIEKASEYLKYPFHNIYYCEDTPKEKELKSIKFTSTLFNPKIKPKKTYFYQSADGQPYYLDKKILSSIILNEGKLNLPLYIFADVKEIKEIILKKDRGNFLHHLADNSIIYIVRINIKS